MDNVTHSIAGLLLAEAAVQARARWAPHRVPSQSFRLAGATAAAVGANLPDADLLYTSFAPDRFAYLLHHRGYTHTVPVALLGAMLVWGAALAVWRARRPAAGGRRQPTAPSTASDRRWLLALLVVALLSHLALDYTNSYGVHPFWPVDNRWFYGDAVFIIEPWLWVAAVPPLIFATGRRATRVVLGLVLTGGLALAWVVSLVPWGAALALTVGAVLSLALAATLRPGARAVAGVAGWALVTLVFVVSSRAARATVTNAAAAAGTRLVDVVITPSPANPFCASAIVVETANDRYRVATARVATAPALLPAARCGTPGPRAPMLRASARAWTPSVRWEREWDAPLADLVSLARENCAVAAMLRFVRVPVWAPAGQTALDVADLRYAGRSGAGFAGFRVSLRPVRCPPVVPPWRPPREELLTGR